MTTAQFDVIVVGGGAAGLTAAIALARAGFATVVVEAAAFPGAENWSGCVYFTENLAHADVLGPAGVEALAWERRLVERGFFATDGRGLLGMTYRDPAAFRNCYTVLRPIYDHHLAHIAQRHGATILAETTVESLIRDGSRVIGVSTHRGALYADLVFLAEGDASHLVTREGYERFNDPREAPKFLQGIKQVIELPPGAVEETFHVAPEEGVAYEMLVRNGTLRGRPLHLNMGGFVYTNRQSLSVGLVLPADNLREHFAGDPNLLTEWFLELPALKPWLREGRRGVFGAKIIRGGGIKDVPHLIDDGLAIGGAASAIGVDFPYPNFTGPATRMGLLIAQAAQQIRAEGGEFTRERLQRYYLEPLRRTHYWNDVDFLRRWPGYVKKTQAFFDRNLDLALGSAYVWTRSEKWLLTRWLNWVRLLLQAAGPTQWHALRVDLRHLTRALRWRDVAARPPLGRLLLDGTVNALRDLFGKPRPNVPPAGKLRVRYSVAGDERRPGERPREVPVTLQRWFQRFAPILASAAQHVYANEPRPLAERLPRAVELLARQVNLVDLLAAAWISLSAGTTGLLLWGWDQVKRVFPRRSGRPPRGIYPRYAGAAQRAGDLTPVTAAASQRWEERLATLAYHSVKTSHIQVLWPRLLPEKNAVADQGLWHVCPAHVYEARRGAQGQVQVVVNYENCIKCETCWRTSDLVNWGRDGLHRFIYPVGSPATGRLLETIHAGTAARPVTGRGVDPWQENVRAMTAHVAAAPSGNGAAPEFLAEARHLLDQLERKLTEFDEALAEEPRTVDRARADYLEMLARYAQQLAARLVDVLRGGWLDEPAGAEPRQQMLALAVALTVKAEERSRQTWDQRFAWAAGTGRQLRDHHLTGLRRLLAASGHEPLAVEPASLRSYQFWLRAEENTKSLGTRLENWRARLDAVFSPQAWRELEVQTPLTLEQDTTLRGLIAEVPQLEADNLARTLHPPERKLLLAELGRRDPALAVRVAAHLWARDLAQLAPGAPLLHEAGRRWARGEEWASFAPLEAARLDAGRGWGEAPFVPAGAAPSFLLLVREQLLVLPRDCRDGCAVQPVATLGLRGSGAVRVVLDGCPLPEARSTVDYHRFRRIWHILSAADLTSIAAGMADVLCRRAVGHATSRVQFPGLFHDEEARDAIGKFGAVKTMIAEMEARRYLIETLDACVSPVDFSASAQERAGLVKATVAEALGTAPGSLSYNAGQVFGGTGYSEDDILAKFYRDASAWRFLGASNVDVYRKHGQEVLRSWRPEGQRLSGVADEGKLFEEVAQRKALQAELDEVRNLRSRLRAAGAERHRTSGESVETEFCEALARQDGHLLASKAALLRTHARLEAGLPAETEIALVRVWMDYVAESLEKFDAVVRPTRQHILRPVIEPSVGPPVMRYGEYLATPEPYDSGDFLGVPLDLTRPRYVPEMVCTDPELAEADRRLRDLMTDYFGRPRPENGNAPYERYIERRHRPDPEDLDFCRQHGFFRMPIPKELGGEGRSKAEYYLVTTNAQRLVDVAISLTIQANTSIGTSPVLIARDKDLPKARKDVGPFAGDTAVQLDVRRQLEDLLKLLDLARLGAPRRIEQAYRKLHARLEETVFARTALRVLTHRFGEAWQRAGQAGLQFDFAGMRAGVEAALAAWNDVCRRADDFHAELFRRLEACDLFLHWVAAGQISAFALTEPSAGSDTARVATRARLRSVPVEKGDAGAYRFVPASGGEPRTLLDANQLDFRPDGVYYRCAADGQTARLRFDEYDYETDDPAKLRYFEHGGRKVYFNDIAQIRQRHGKLWYDYWELTGAKMWITNGRMSGIMCLYAKVEESWVSGVTGFMVDRHAEGLVVGKDEAKMGQCGSPTNELSLQAVRVPRENVIGLESRGQVNALETLNVGRAGLSMSAMAQMAGIIAASRDFTRARYGEVPDWVAWRLERMEEIRFVAEALGYDVIGRFEHPQTKSVRMESAIAKMVNSELLHRLIEWAEDIHGLAGQTQLHLIEKRKRDARILNIYEGTNEVQRSAILKDLVEDVAPRWAAAPRTPPQHVGHEALALETLKNDFRLRVEAAKSLFGAELWRNPSLQANCFLLAEAAAWLKAAESTLGRLAWLNRYELAAGEGADATVPLPLDVPELLQRGRQALGRCQVEVKNRLQRFDEELAHLRRGFYAPEIRAASLVFLRHEHPATVAPDVRSEIHSPLRVLVVVEPWAADLPQPHVRKGRLSEPRLTLGAADRAALETALRLRDQAEAAVFIDVAAVAPRTALSALRALLNLGIERVRLVVPDVAPVMPDSAAAALAYVLRPEKFDLVLYGESGSEDEGVLGRLVAVALGVKQAGTAARLAVRATRNELRVGLQTSDGPSHRVRNVPAAIGLEAGLSLRSFRTEEFVNSLRRGVEVVRWPKKVPARRLHLLPGGTAATTASEEQPQPLAPPAAAQRLLLRLGHAGTSFAPSLYDGVIEDGPPPELAEAGRLTVAVIAADPEGRLLPAAHSVVQAAQVLSQPTHGPVEVVLLAPPREDAQRRALGQLLAWHGGDVLMVPADGLPHVRTDLLIDCWSALTGCEAGDRLSGPSVRCPRFVIGEPWTEDAFAALAAARESFSQVVLRVRRLQCQEGDIVCETTRSRGKLTAQQHVAAEEDDTVWLSVAGEVEVQPLPPPPTGTPRVRRWTPPLDRFFTREDVRELLDEVKQEMGLVRLADADFIIDVGYGVGNRDGFEAVIEPLEKALRALGVQNVVVGGSRKVTEELHLLPVDRQIGQSGVSVNPQILLAIGISGAPQHLNYIGPRATILAFNRDPEAPLLTLNTRRPRPRVFPVLGDLFETVPAFTTALQQEQPGPAAPATPAAAAVVSG